MASHPYLTANSHVENPMLALARNECCQWLYHKAADQLLMNKCCQQAAGNNTESRCIPAAASPCWLTLGGPGCSLHLMLPCPSSVPDTPPFWQKWWVPCPGCSQQWTSASSQSGRPLLQHACGHREGNGIMMVMAPSLLR